MELKPIVGVIMGSKSDWKTMIYAVEILDKLEIPNEVKIVSAHRTPDQLFEYAGSAKGRGIEIIICGAGGAAHLAGMTAAKTSIPVLGVPIKSKSLKGMDSLLSTVQMPFGIPVATFAIGKAGAANAALFAASILSNKYKEIEERLDSFRKEQTQLVLENSGPRKD